MSATSLKIIDASDWIFDLRLRQCSLPARAVLVDVLALMARTGGRLTLPEAAVLGMTGISAEDYHAGLAELLRYDALQQDQDGIYSADLVRAERARLNGKRGGNPA